MARYAILAGSISHHGRHYRKGGTIELDDATAKAIGPGKLKRIDEPQQFEAPAAIPSPTQDWPQPQPAAKPEPKPAKAKAEEPAPHDMGDDVTDEFDGAAEAGLKVYVRNGWYNVVAADDKEPLNEKAMRRPDAESFVAEQS
jgi:hypothetical protein